MLSIGIYNSDEGPIPTAQIGSYKMNSYGQHHFEKGSKTLCLTTQTFYKLERLLPYIIKDLERFNKKLDERPVSDTRSHLQ